ncbi:MAG TPA: SDR family NAD(P)-dependent oxidoreductase, partial [Thermoplasmata archaeon]|nr:SDR family NAD(P)-dependent oxidoreductase [Thermoplasmata archaeon]
LAQELEEAHVAVVAVDPGDLRTAMHQAAFAGEDISDRPLPEATVPFWAWLFGQAPGEVTGQRFQAQSERWGLAR